MSSPVLSVVRGQEGRIGASHPTACSVLAQPSSPLCLRPPRSRQPPKGPHENGPHPPHHRAPQLHHRRPRPRHRPPLRGQPPGRHLPAVRRRQRRLRHLRAADHLLRNSCPRAVPLPRPRHPQMGGFCPECQQQPGLPVLPAGAGRLHRADAGQPGPGTAGPLHHRRHRPRPGLTPVPLRSHPCLQLHAVPLGYLPPARLDGDHLWHPLPPAHPRPPSPRPLLWQGAPEKGLLAGRPCGEPRPRAVPGLAEVGERGNCPALSRTQGLMPWMCPGQPCPIPAPAQPHIGTWLLPSPAMGQTHPLDATSQDT